MVAWNPCHENKEKNKKSCLVSKKLNCPVGYLHWPLKKYMLIEWGMQEMGYIGKARVVNIIKGKQVLNRRGKNRLIGWKASWIEAEREKSDMMRQRKRGFIVCLLLISILIAKPAVLPDTDVLNQQQQQQQLADNTLTHRQRRTEHWIQSVSYTHLTLPTKA